MFPDLESAEFYHQVTTPKSSQRLTDIEDNDNCDHSYNNSFVNQNDIEINDSDTVVAVSELPEPKEEESDNLAQEFTSVPLQAPTDSPDTEPSLQGRPSAQHGDCDDAYSNPQRPVIHAAASAVALSGSNTSVRDMGGRSASTPVLSSGQRAQDNTIPPEHRIRQSILLSMFPSLQFSKTDERDIEHGEVHDEDNDVNGADIVVSLRRNKEDVERGSPSWWVGSRIMLVLLLVIIISLCTGIGIGLSR